MKRFFIVALLISFAAGTLAVTAMADEQGDVDKPQRAGSNLLLGWTEVPDAIMKTTKETDNPFLGITVGLLKGIANAFARTTSGAVDVVALPAHAQKEQIVKDSMIEVGSGQAKQTK